MENKKILIVTSSYLFVNLFLLPHIKYLATNGWFVHVASADDGSVIPFAHKQINIPISRSPFKADNIKAIKALKEIIEKENYNIIHCHTPIGAMVARLAACKARKTLGTKVIYTAHGFHFYNGAPLKNWLLYYTAEKCLAPLTDAIITINNEDYEMAQRHLSGIRNQYKTSGIGYDLNHIGLLDKSQEEAVRKRHNINKNDFVCLYVASMCDRKNHNFILKSIPNILTEIPHLKMIFLGDGEKLEDNIRLTQQLGIAENVRFEGFQKNISDYLLMADIAISASKREGLPMNIIEEMYAGLAIVASEISGHTDLITNGQNGYLFTLGNSKEFVDKIIHLYNNPDKRAELGKNAQRNVSKYSVDNVIAQISRIYTMIL